MVVVVVQYRSTGSLSRRSAFSTDCRCQQDAIVSLNDYDQVCHLRRLIAPRTTSTTTTTAISPIPQNNSDDESTLSSSSVMEDVSFGAVQDPPLDVLKIRIKDFAAQLTLHDLPVFCAITADELTSCGWSSKARHDVAPNVAELTHRFNCICHWVTREIINVEKTSKRAEVLKYFIRLSKKLLDYKNIHGSFAVVSALLCESVYRLRRTWEKVGEKERHTFEKLSDLFSADSNFARLRAFTSNCSTPCIPHLGTFLMDFTYIQDAMRKTPPPQMLGERSTHQDNMNMQLRMLAGLQDSKYEDLHHNDVIQLYIDRVIHQTREQLKGEENLMYQLSLEREPMLQPDQAPSPRRSSMPGLSRIGFKLTWTPNTLSRMADETNKSAVAAATVKSKSLTPNLTVLGRPTSVFTKGHKKTCSMGDASAYGIDNAAFHDLVPSTSADSIAPGSETEFNRTTDSDLGIDSIDSLMFSSVSSALRSTSQESVDCVCNVGGSWGKKNGYGKSRPSDGCKEPLLDGSGDDYCSGVLHKTVIRKPGNKSFNLSYSHRIFGELHHGFFVEYDRKTIKLVVASTRDMFKSKASRVIDLRFPTHWRSFRSSSSMNAFELRNEITGEILLYRCDSALEASEWLARISNVSKPEHEEQTSTGSNVLFDGHSHFVHL